MKRKPPPDVSELVHMTEDAMAVALALQRAIAIKRKEFKKGTPTYDLMLQIANDAHLTVQRIEFIRQGLPRVTGG